MKMVEIEKRVLLTDTKFKIFLKNLKTKAKLVRKFKRFTIVHVIHPDSKPDLENPLDIRVRTTENGGKLTVKVGKIHKDSSRQEYEMDIKVEQIPTLFSVLKLLGFTNFITTYLERSEFSLKGLTVTADKYFSIDANLVEVEADTGSKIKISKAENLINDFLNQNNLTPLSPSGLAEFIERVNSVKKMRVDFGKKNPDTWFKKWKDYIYCKV